MDIVRKVILGTILALGGVLAWLSIGEGQGTPLDRSRVGNRESMPGEARLPAEPEPQRGDPGSRPDQQSENAINGVGAPVRERMTRSIAELSDSDRKLFLHVNARLEFAGREPILASSRIADEDLPAFREAVTESRAVVKKALLKWRTSARVALRPLRDKLFADLKAGVTEGLPLLGPENPMSRRHPYEALSQVGVGDQMFVLRASVDDHPDLLEAGESMRDAEDRRLARFESIVRPLF